MDLSDLLYRRAILNAAYKDIVAMIELHFGDRTVGFVTSPRLEDEIKFEGFVVFSLLSRLYCCHN